MNLSVNTSPNSSQRLIAFEKQVENINKSLNDTLNELILN
jgi:hypothetical protein